MKTESPFTARRVTAPAVKALADASRSTKNTRFFVGFVNAVIKPQKSYNFRGPLFAQHPCAALRALSECSAFRGVFFEARVPEKYKLPYCKMLAKQAHNS